MEPNKQFENLKWDELTIDGDELTDIRRIEIKTVKHKDLQAACSLTGGEECDEGGNGSEDNCSVQGEGKIWQAYRWFWHSSKKKGAPLPLQVDEHLVL